MESRLRFVKWVRTGGWRGGGTRPPFCKGVGATWRRRGVATVAMPDTLRWIAVRIPSMSALCPELELHTHCCRQKYVGFSSIGAKAHP